MMESSAGSSKGLGRNQSGRNQSGQSGEKGKNSGKHDGEWDSSEAGGPEAALIAKLLNLENAALAQVLEAQRKARYKSWPTKQQKYLITGKVSDLWGEKARQFYPDMKPNLSKAYLQSNPMKGMGDFGVRI